MCVCVCVSACLVLGQGVFSYLFENVFGHRPDKTGSEGGASQPWGHQAGLARGPTRILEFQRNPR